MPQSVQVIFEYNGQRFEFTSTTSEELPSKVVMPDGKVLEVEEWTLTPKGLFPDQGAFPVTFGEDGLSPDEIAKILNVPAATLVE